MKLWNTKTETYLEAVIEPIESEDIGRVLEDERFGFDWRKELQYEIYKISREDDDQILGLIALRDVSKELRLEIQLIEISKENRGREKIIDHIAGCLIAFACQMAFDNGYEGFVSLIPKTNIIKLYVEKYGFQPVGNQLFTELENSQNLIKKYLQ